MGENANAAMKEKLGFMFKKISASSTAISYWLSVPEFMSQMQRMAMNDETIDDLSVYEAMKSIYSSYESLRNNSAEKPDFNYRLARRGILQIERALNK